MNRNRARLTENPLHRVIKESVRRVLMENEDNEPNIYDFYVLIDKYGWASSDSQDVVNKSNGQTGVRFVLEKYGFNNKTVDFEILKQEIISVFGYRAIFGNAQYKYAKENSHPTVIITGF